MSTDPLTLDNQVCFAAVLAARTVVSLYRPILEALGARDGRSISDLGGALQLEPATLTPLLKRLEAAGLVRRARSDEDERVVRVTLTDAGRALREQAEHVPGRIAARTGMSIAELTQLRDTLRGFVDRLGAAPAGSVAI
jgi:DNA-binding MarR family transcriptional regulator